MAKIIVTIIQINYTSHMRSDCTGSVCAFASVRHSHDARYIADGHRAVVGPALSLLVLAAVRLLAGGRVVRHFDGRAAGLLPLPQLPQLFGQSRQVLWGRDTRDTVNYPCCFRGDAQLLL